MTTTNQRVTPTPHDEESQHFPIKLHRMICLESEANSSLVRWSESGFHFFLDASSNRRDELNLMINSHFSGCGRGYESVKKNLNLYGFKHGLGEHKKGWWSNESFAFHRVSTDESLTQINRNNKKRQRNDENSTSVESVEPNELLNSILSDISDIEWDEL